MQLKRFQGPTISDAYDRVRETLGEDAVIVSTRSASVPGMLRGSTSRFVEVLAGVPETGDYAGMAGIDLATDAAAHDLVRGIAEATASGIPTGIEDLEDLNDLEDTEAGTGSALAPPFINSLAGAWNRRGPFDLWDASNRAPEDVGSIEGMDMAALAALDRPDSPAQSASITEVANDLELAPAMQAAAAAGNNALLATIAEQVVSMRDTVEQLAADRTNSRVDAGPEGLRDLRTRLVEQGVAPSVVISLLDQLAGTIVPDATPSQVLQAAERRLAAALPPVVRLDLARGPMAIFIVGPGGSGKTSLAVRLAHELASERGARVVLAGADVNRAGAPQQLVACAAATGLPVRLCYAPGELKALINEGPADVVIVDTPGHTGARRERLAELSAFLQMAPQRSVWLTVPATMKTADVLRMATAFAPFHLGALVPTRVDETTSYGGLVSAAIEAGVGIAYTTRGDAISEGLQTGDNHALATATLTARWPQAAPASIARGRMPSAGPAAAARAG